MSSISWSKEIGGLQFKVFLFEEPKDKIQSRDLDNPAAAGEKLSSLH